MDVQISQLFDLMSPYPPGKIEQILRALFQHERIYDLEDAISFAAKRIVEKPVVPLPGTAFISQSQYRTFVHIRSPILKKY